MSNRSTPGCSLSTSVVQTEMKSSSTKFNSYPLTVYFDGDCPICRREIHLMTMLNRKARLHFVDFSGSSYRPEDHGLAPCDLARVIHARWSDGNLITGVEVFRTMWEGVGLGFLARFSRIPWINSLLFKAYAWFAKNRLRLTGRT